MPIVSIGDKFHELSFSVFLENKKNITNFVGCWISLERGKGYCKRIIYTCDYILNMHLYFNFNPPHYKDLLIFTHRHVVSFTFTLLLSVRTYVCVCASVINLVSVTQRIFVQFCRFSLSGVKMWIRFLIPLF